MGHIDGRGSRERTNVYVSGCLCAVRSLCICACSMTVGPFEFTVSQFWASLFNIQSITFSLKREFAALTWIWNSAFTEYHSPNLHCFIWFSFLYFIHRLFTYSTEQDSSCETKLTCWYLHCWIHVVYSIFSSMTVSI